MGASVGSAVGNDVVDGFVGRKALDEMYPPVVAVATTVFCSSSGLLQKTPSSEAAHNMTMAAKMVADEKVIRYRIHEGESRTHEGKQGMRDE